MPYISKKQLAELRKIAEIANMATSSFGFNCQEKFVCSLESFGEKGLYTPDEFIKERTRIWRESWIVNPILNLCDDIEKK